jgi:hypothetical protein
MHRFPRRGTAVLLSAIACVLAAPTAGVAACRDSVSSASTFRRGGPFKATFNACSAGTVRVGLVALEDAHRGNLALRRTVVVDAPGPGVARTTIGSLATGRYRLVLITAAGKHVRGHVVRILRHA